MKRPNYQQIEAGFVFEHNYHMIFKDDGSIDGKLVYGHEAGWHWSKNKGGYHQGRDFFWVHWEISDREPTTVKLHVECPKKVVAPELNAIKQEIVSCFLAPQFKKMVEENGYTYKPTNRSKPEHVEKFKCTSPFHIVLTKEQDKGSHRANIEMVNEALGDDVRNVIEKFIARLKSQFPS